MIMFDNNETDILHICNNFDKFFINYFNSLSSIDTQYKHEVYYFRERSRGFPQLKLPNYVHLSFPFDSIHKYFFRIRGRKILNNLIDVYDINKFSITHAHTLFTNGYISYLIYKKFKIPYVVAIRSTDIDFYMKYRKDLKIIMYKILDNASKIVFISHANMKSFYSKISFNVNELTKKSYVIPNGIDDFYLENSPVSYFVNKSRDDVFKVLTVGYIGKRKNQLNTAKALERLQKEGVKIQYTVVGRILDLHYYNKLLKFNFVKHIEFTNKEELLNIYRENNLYVMVSTSETFGLTYIEALSQGLPIIYSQGSGVDGFIDNVVGIGSKTDYISIYKSIRKFINNKACFDQSDSIKFSSNFSWCKLQKRYIGIYNSIMK